MSVARTICQGFIAVITIGTFLLMMPFSISDGSWNNPITALFTATSAVCVTGLSVVDVGVYYSFLGQIFLLILVQVGAFGYMTATTLLLLLIGRQFRLKEKAALQQSLDREGWAGVVPLLRSVLATTVVFELVGVVFLLLVFVPVHGFLGGIWYAVFHSINAFNNAGFSLYSDGLVRYINSPILTLVMTILIIFGGLGYDVIMEIYYWGKARIKRERTVALFSLHFKVVTSTTIFLLFLGLIIFFLVEFNNPNTLGNVDFGSKILGAWFQSVTTRTAGFNTIDIGQLTDVGLFTTIALMFIGASPGSTGGGIKTTTFRILLNCTKAALRGRDRVLCYQRQIPTAVIIKAVGMTCGSALVVTISTILVALSDSKLELLPIFFEVVSAFGTVGLSTGITSSISAIGQLVLVATMYIGRVGILLLMAAILGETKVRVVQYPEENLLV
jgi:trk system potassium uptake protein TrkH